MLLRPDFETREAQLLAPYAVLSRDSRGRVYPEPQSDSRMEFERDRDRIIHSRAFRRLKHKTQVFVATEGDHYRTRLTHTLEVAQIARHLARLLNLNEDLVETIALAHDLGHTPFGHKGEEVLDALIQDIGGFEHNQQSLRVVEVIEKKYPGFNGLNLSYEVLAGLRKHETPWDVPNAPKDMEGPSLEAQCVNLADEVAYNNHDLDDGFEAGLILADPLESVALWKIAERKATEGYANLTDREKKNLTVRALIGWQIQDIAEESTRRLAAQHIQTLPDVYGAREKLVDYASEMSAMNAELRTFLRQNFYQHPKVLAMNEKANTILCALFPYYLHHPEPVLVSLSHLIEPHPPAPHTPDPDHEPRTSNLERFIADYIAGMTDNFATAEYGKIAP
jgi:dGTPase